MPVHFVWSRAARLVRRCPLVTNVSIGLAFGLASDYTQQRRAKSSADWDRCTRFAASTAPCTTVLHYWYRWLDGRWPGSTMRTVVRKMLMDVSVMTPVCAVGNTAVLTLLDGSGWEALKKRLSTSLLLMVVCDVCVFAPIQSINFRFFSPQARILVVYIGAFAYYSLMSYALYEYAGIKYGKDEG